MINLDYTNLRNTQEDHMFDVCSIYTVTTSGYDEYGQPVTINTTTSGVPCGVEMTGGTTSYRGQIYPTTIDAVLRLSTDTQVTILDTITITERSGDTVSENYSVISEPRRGPSAIRVVLQRILI